MKRHGRALALDGGFPRFVKTDFAQAVRLPIVFKPLIDRKPDLDLVVVAIVHHVQVRGLISELEGRKGRDGNLFRLCDIDWRLDAAGGANALPVIGPARSLVVGEFWLALIRDPTRKVHIHRMGMLMR